MAMPPHRFVVLDSLRGICALMVALFHLNANSIFKQLPFFTNAYLFVDFFFVLSGFVLATNYQQRLTNGFGIQKFMLLRFGRLYPLYFTVLIGFFIAEAVFEGATAFGSPQKSIGTVSANIFLFQIFGIFSFDTWNWPGWSIAAEFWTCLLFAVIAATWPRRLITILMGLSIISIYFIATQSNTGMNVTYNLGMLRSVIGFSTGVFVCALWDKINNYQIDERLAFVVETLCVLFVFFFVSAVAQGNYSLFAPIVFAIVVLVFAKERGPISSLLKYRVFLVLGLWSYSIYIVHLFVGRMLAQTINKVQLLSGQQLIIKVAHESEFIDVLGLNLAQGNMWACVYLVFVVGVAALTYRYIELPSRLWFRKQAQIVRP
jgi:peptidoglycan/LPS O-acetylase OafA/YrhL